MRAFAAKYHQGDKTAAVEALLRNGPNVKYMPDNAYADAKLRAETIRPSRIRT